MSMIGVLVRVPEEQLNTFLKESVLFEEYIDSEEYEQSDRHLDLDKTWEAINYLLTGHTIDTIEEASPPLGHVFFSDHKLDDELDMGYGPPYYIVPAQVKIISDALKDISPAKLLSKYNAQEFNQKNVYPNAWEDSEDHRDFIAEKFTQLKEFYSAAAMEGDAIITFVS